MSLPVPIWRQAEAGQVTSYTPRNQFVTRLWRYTLNLALAPVETGFREILNYLTVIALSRRVMEYVGGTSQYLLSAHGLELNTRVLATSRRILKCFRVVDLGYFITGLALTVSSVTNSEETLRQNFDNLLYGCVLLLFSVLSALCNALGVRALDREARSLLIPWLVLYPWVIVILLAGVLHTLWVTDFHLELYQV